MDIKEKIKTAHKVTVHKTLKSFVSGGLINDFIEIEYFFDKHTKSLYSRLVFGKIAQGPPNHAHGGATAAVLDEVMGAAAWMNKLHSVTAQLKIDYIKAIPLNKEVFIEACIDKVEGKKVTIKGSLFDESGIVYAETESLFVDKGKDTFQQMGAMPEDIFTFDV
jgi:acyl-coenzyme A thioesterase PaaI-like protein